MSQPADVRTETMAEHRWVADYAKCTIERQFLALLATVERDVQDANTLADAVREGVRFETSRDESDPRKPLLTVARLQQSRDDTPQAVCRVLLDMERQDIVISPPHRESFRVVARWDEEEGACHLYVNDTGQPWPLWRLSQRALVPLIFGWECVK